METPAARFARLFDAVDFDGNGLIERTDFAILAAAVARESGHPLESPRLRKVARTLNDLWRALEAVADADRNGSVDRAEFVAFGERLVAESEALGGKAPPAALQVIDAMYLAMDMDGDGRITREEWAAFLRAVRMGVDPAATFAALDLNGDGILDLDELDALVVNWLRYGFERPTP